MTKITKLTPAQEAEMPRFRQRYIEIACGGARTDRPALQGALTELYALINKPAPQLLVLDSPAACMMAIKALKSLSGDQIWAQIRTQIWAQIWAQIRGSTASRKRFL